MIFQDLVILLPCHSLEDFPTYHEGEDADSLLASWSGLWHPCLIEGAGKLPTWARVDTPPHEVSNQLLVVPSVSISQLPTGFAQRVKDGGGLLIRKPSTPDELLGQALRDYPQANDLPPDTLADFLALGVCYLQVQLLTRQMRYSSSLDEAHFLSLVVSAASAALRGDASETQARLAQCFQLLAQERDRYYPVPAYLLDWTFVDIATSGERLRRELQTGAVINLQLSIETLLAIADRDPSLVDELRRRLASGDLDISISESSESRLPLLSLETMRAQLSRASQEFTRLLQTAAAVYGRRRFGLTPQMPQVLHKLGFQAAVHCSADQGKTPRGTQSKTRWAGLDGSTIDIFGQEPLDANQTATFLSLASKLGASMDSDHIATLCLAHWPGHSSPWYDVLRRIARHTHALGQFVTFRNYFADTDSPGQTDRFEAHQYRSPYLQQSVIRRESNPLSMSSRYWQLQARCQSVRQLQALVELSGGRNQAVPADCIRFEVDGDQPSVLCLGDFDRRLREVTQELSLQLVEPQPQAAPGILVLNPWNRPRRVGFTHPLLTGLPELAKPIYAASVDGEVQHTVVDVPAFGFAWVSGSVSAAAGVPSRGGVAAARGRKDPPIAEANILRNEFFEAILNPVTGSLQAFREYGARRNRISQQLAFRDASLAQADGGSDAAMYSVMACDRIEVTRSDTTFGQIETRGRLLNRTGATLATFCQRYSLWRGSRVLQIDARLEPIAEPVADPWNSYYACRWAWGDELAELYHTVHESRQPVRTARFEAPLYVDLLHEPRRTTILCGGLTFHRRAGDAMLDTILIARGESSREFHFGLGLDLTHPHHDARELLQPPLILDAMPGVPRSSPHGWLLHLDNRDLQVTDLRVLRDHDRVGGFALRILESRGVAGRALLRAFRPIGSARSVDFRGEVLAECGVENGAVKLEFAGHEWLEIEVRWPNQEKTA
jgi:alpha-mannosidase